MRIANLSMRLEYVLEADRGSQEQTVFVLRRLEQAKLTEASGLLSLSVARQRRIAGITAAARRERRELTAEELAALDAAVPDWQQAMPGLEAMHAFVCRHGIDAIRGLVDQDGKPTEITPTEFVKHAPFAILAELGDEIMRLSTPIAVERREGAPAHAAQH